MMIFNHGCSHNVDGTGTRLVFYLKGCNFCCDWCGAPDSISQQPQTMHYPNRTVIVGQSVTADWVISKALRSKTLIDGVTFGGGEPTLQSDELIVILQVLQQNSIHTAMESNASTPAYRQVIPHVDQLFSDLKTVDENKFTTRINPCAELLDQVKNNLRYAANIHCDLTIRIPVITGLNDQTCDQRQIADFLSDLQSDGGKFKVELLRQHHIAEPKYAAMRRDYLCKGASVPNDGCMANFKALLNQHSIKVL